MSLIKIIDSYESNRSGHFLQVALLEMPPSELNGFHGSFEVHQTERKRYKTEDEARGAFEKALGKKKSYNEAHRLT